MEKGLKHKDGLHTGGLLKPKEQTEAHELNFLRQSVK